MTKEKIIDNIARLNSETWRDREEVRTEIGKLLSELKNALEQPTSDDCVSRQAVIDLIDPCYANCGTLGGLANCIEEMVKDLPPVTPTQSWIPISEEMPKEGETVLVCYRTQEGISQSVCEWLDMPNRGIVWSTLCGNTPIAWQPLPKAYEEK
jgi:hypothetical protein